MNMHLSMQPHCMQKRMHHKDASMHIVLLLTFLKRDREIYVHVYRYINVHNIDIRHNNAEVEFSARLHD